MLFTIFYLTLHVLFGALPTSPTNAPTPLPWPCGWATPRQLCRASWPLSCRRPLFFCNTGPD
jgi:hypothetical protein